MSDSIFEEGGPHKIRRLEGERFEMSISIPTDAQGMIGRECPREGCAPGYFKVKNGTGITGEQLEAYCPYCRHTASPDDFATAEQQRFARDVATREATLGFQKQTGRALGLGPTGMKRLGGELFSIDITLETTPPAPVREPDEEELRRDVVCTGCTLAHAVFGLATWCPDCGRDVFLQHIGEEISDTRKIARAAIDRRAAMGARVAARDVENSLEDLVSIFEATLKHTTRRHLAITGQTETAIEHILSHTIRNAYQSVDRGAAAFLRHTGIDLLAEETSDALDTLRSTFEKRHPITHSLGVVDRQYLNRSVSGGVEGRDIRVTAVEVVAAADIAERILTRAYERACTPPPA